MTFGKIDRLISECEKHMDANGARGTEIESYFVQFLLTRIVAEYEARIIVLVHRRCSRTRDAHVVRFAGRSAKDACKNFAISELKGILGRFGDDYKSAFHASVVNHPAHTAWDNIYNNRQAVAHGSGATMTFSDLTKNYRDSLGVFDGFVTVLNLRPTELRDLQ